MNVHLYIHSDKSKYIDTFSSTVVQLYDSNEHINNNFQWYRLYKQKTPTHAHTPSHKTHKKNTHKKTYKKKTYTPKKKHKKKNIHTKKQKKCCLLHVTCHHTYIICMAYMVKIKFATLS
jgi:hypothetical protein